MLTVKIVDSDAFLDMPLSTQALYFHLNMRADDDGFVNNPKKIQRMIGASEDDLKLLVIKRFILAFESGIIVIKHWRMHNLLRKDRYNPTQYQEELMQLDIKENGSYTERGNQLTTNWQPTDNQLAPQVSIGKDSIGEESIDNKRQRFIPPTLEDVKAYCEERKNNVDAQNFVDFYESKGWMVGKNKMKDWRACVRTWEKKSAPKKTNITIPMPDYIKDQIERMDRDLLLKEINDMKGDMHS